MRAGADDPRRAARGRTARAAAAAVLLASAAAPAAGAPAADPLVAAVRAEAARIGPQAFERVSETTDRSGTTVRRVERFVPEGRSGRGTWTLVSVDGREPTAAERRRHAREAAAAPAPGYWRLATILSGPHERLRDGQAVYRFQPLAPGSIRTDRADLSAGLAAEAAIDPNGGRPVVRSLRIFAPAPFPVLGVARVLRFEAENRYAEAPDGTPYLAAQTSRAEVRAPVVGLVATTTRQTFRPLP